MFYTRKKRFDVYRDYFNEIDEEPFSDILNSEVSPKKADSSDIAAEDVEPMGLFSLNSVNAAVKHLSPRKQPPEISLLNISRSSILSANYSINTPSSLHLSAFEQPPQGTSTPAPGTDLATIHSPLRPPDYPEPMFRFVSNDSSFDTDASMVSGEGLNSLQASTSINRIRDEISAIVDRMKTSVHINTVHDVDVDVDVDTCMGDDLNVKHESFTDFSLPDVSALSVVPFPEVSTSTPKSIMKKHDQDTENYPKKTSGKRLRINETVEVIVLPSRVKNKRPLSSQVDGNSRKKYRNPKVEEYKKMLENCKGEKDPINLLS